MNTGCLSMYLGLLFNFFSDILFSFLEYRFRTFFGLNVFLCILFFLMALQMELFFFISFSDCSLQFIFLCRSYNLSELLSANSIIIVCVFLRFSVDKVVLSMNRDRLTSTFNLGALCFFYIECLAATSSTVLRRSGENGYPCLISYLGEKHAVFHH